MPQPLCTEAEFIELFERHGASKTAEILKTDERSVYGRRRSIEKRKHKMIRRPKYQNKLYADIPEHPGRLTDEVKDGVVLIGSDSHYIPGVITTAHRAFVKFCKDIKPAIIIKNGDELDFSSISRFAPIGWEKRPAVQNEIETALERLAEIEDASKNSKLYWPLGNHDARFETRLATVAPEYAKVHGVHLKDHFPRWKPCWSVWLNENTVIKHRYRGGVHATRNNTINSGMNIFTGHLHSLKVAPFSDYNGTRWGVDTGTLAEPGGEQFVDYTEDNPKDWRSGFVVATYHKGELLWPETVFVRGPGEYEFRGKVYSI